MRRDSLLGLCVVRAGEAHVRDELAAGRDPDKPPTKRETMRALWSSTGEASKVASVVVLWALALDELDVDELGPEAFSEWAAESRATVYRRLAEFRRLWPEYETPNELARQVVAAARARGGKFSPSLPIAV